MLYTKEDIKLLTIKKEKNITEEEDVSNVTELKKQLEE